MLVGLLYTLIGTILFLTGVNTGFAPVGIRLGADLAGGPFKMDAGSGGDSGRFYIVKAEPAVQVLNNQVEEITNGTVSRGFNEPAPFDWRGCGGGAGHDKGF